MNLGLLSIHSGQVFEDDSKKLIVDESKQIEYLPLAV